jgi:periplasmic divalent cation tolerance protein
MSDATLLVYCTCPDEATAVRLAEAAVADALAACGNILGSVRSIYRWEGRIEHGDEVLLVLKTTESAYPGLENLLANRHPYEVPEIIATPVTRGLGSYIDWVKACTRKA